jgi:uncharacterized protein
LVTEHRAWIYDVEVTHVRASPVRHEVRQRSYQWFVDLDALPRLPRLLRPLGRFDARDHVGDPRRSIRDNVDEFLAESGIDLHGGRITMLTNARSLGYVFNALTLFWCHTVAGDPAAVVAEVHNTYGQRHRYLIRPDESGRAETAKQFFVSPFYPVDGYYRMRVPEPDQRLAISVTLHRPGDRPFTAALRGRRRPATVPAVLATVLRPPLVTWRVGGQIARHGIALYLKGVPLAARPEPPEEMTMTSPSSPPGLPPRCGTLPASIFRSGCARGTAARLARRRALRSSFATVARCAVCSGAPVSSVSPGPM